jgi:hypothetical protein
MQITICPVFTAVPSALMGGGIAASAREENAA